jgi:predicted HD superfamily hydrolase involved in NAD metabolism
MKYSIEELKSIIKELMSEKRYNHSIMVMEEAKKYIEKYNKDDSVFYEKTIRAALMHDTAKEMNENEIEEYIKDNNIDLDISNPINRPLIHGIIGADKCIKLYDFDEEMAQSIRWHTTGSTNMSLMDKIVFLADKTGRNNLSPALEEVREKAFENLDKGIYLYITNNIEKLKVKEVPINPISLDVYNYYFNKIKKN